MRLDRKQFCGGIFMFLSEDFLRMWDKIFWSGPRKICGPYPFKFFKSSFPQILLCLFVNTLSHIILTIIFTSMLYYKKLQDTSCKSVQKEFRKTSKQRQRLAKHDCSTTVNLFLITVVTYCNGSQHSIVQTSIKKTLIW